MSDVLPVPPIPPAASAEALSTRLPATQGPVSEAALKQAAVKFEATFLAEMLQHTGLGALREGFNGGPGEKQFSAFLIREYAMEIARTRPLGIGEQIVAALAEQDGQ